MTLKVGDKVIVKRQQCVSIEKGTIVEVRLYKDVKGKGYSIQPDAGDDSVYFYAVMDDREVGTKHGWSYNIFNFDRIWLDTERMREENLNKILK